MHTQLMAAFRKQTGSVSAVTGTALGQSQCVCWCSAASLVTIHVPASVCRRRRMFWWWLTLMLQAEPHRHQLTGGTGWLRTYRYSNSVSGNIRSGKIQPCVFWWWQRHGQHFLIGLGSRLLQIYEVVEFFFSKIVHFHNLGSHLAWLVFTSALWPIATLKNYEWFLSLTWCKKDAKFKKC